MADESIVEPDHELARVEFGNAKRLAEALEWLLNYPGISGGACIATKGDVDPKQAGAAILTRQVIRDQRDGYGPKVNYIIILKALSPEEAFDPWRK